MIRSLLPALLAISTVTLPAQVPDTSAQWRTLVTGWRIGSGYQLADTLPAVAATVTDGSGSGFVLRNAAAVDGTTFGSVGATVPAHAFRGRRVRVRAELRSRGVTGGGSLWVRVDGGSGMLGLDNGQNAALTGDTEWRAQELTLDVPREAVRIVFGGLLRGSGELAVRRLFIIPRDLPDANAPIAAEALVGFDSAVAIMRTHALVRDTVSWDIVIPDYRKRLAGAAKREDAYLVVAMLARRLGDRHSFFRPPMLMTPAGPQAANSPPRAETPVGTRWIADARVGYLKVPAHGGSSLDASRVFVADARAAIAAMADSGACAWVVDLRGNGGGNMWPMLSALRPLLGDSVVGAFKSPTSTNRWGVTVPGRSYDSALPAPRDLTAAPVAVLTDGRTVSSGEATYTAFRGRPNTRSFGMPTGGLSTANQGFMLPGGGMLLLTVSVYVDRLGNEYGARMPTDEEVPEAEGVDAPLARALGWLSQQGNACHEARRSHP